MSDRIPADIWIGGKIPASLVPGLCAAVTDEGLSPEWGNGRVRPTGTAEPDRRPERKRSGRTSALVLRR